MGNEEYLAQMRQIETLLKVATLPADRTGIRPMVRRKEYRGKKQVVVGYSWSRPGASMYRGAVYDAVLGAGDTFEEAFAKANKKLL